MIASANGTLMLLVGDPRPGIWPIRLPSRMKTKMRAEQRQELAALRAHVAFEHADEERDDVLEDDLQLAGIVDAQRRADGQADEEDEERDQPDEDQVIGHVDPERREQQIDERDERGGMFNCFHSQTLYNVSQGPRACGLRASSEDQEVLR